MTRTVLFGSVVLCLGIGLSVNAEQPAAKPAADSESADIAGLIEQLQRPEFAEREEATRRLSEEGKAAFPQLEKAAAGSSREASARALEVIKGHFQRGDNETKNAAKETLERLAQNSNVSIAQRAQNILNPPPEPTAVAGGFGALPLNVANLRVQVAGNVVPAVGRSVSISRSANGEIKIQHRENGKSTKIESAPGGKITAEVTEQQNGKEVTRKLEAADLEALKKQDAEVAKIYEQYSQPRVQVGVMLPPALPGFAPPGLPTQVESLKRTIATIDAQIQRMQAQLPNNPAAQRSLDSLKNIKQTYERRLQSLQPAEPPKPAPAVEKGVGGQ